MADACQRELLTLAELTMHNLDDLQIISIIGF